MLPIDLVQKIGFLVDLDPAEREAIANLPVLEEDVGAKRDFLQPGDTPTFLYMVVSGWAARYGLRANGSRRITGFLLPGDFCGIHAVTSSAMDHAVLALTDCRVAKIDRDAMGALVGQYPSVGVALWRAKLVEEAILRRWLLKTTDSLQVISHMLCELHARSALVGHANGSACLMPLTQEEIGDAAGITGVHTNRVIQRLRHEQLIDLQHRRLTILNLPKLRRTARFDPSYLRPWR